MNLSIIIATCGRKELQKLILSLYSQLDFGDEIIVVEDGSRRHMKFCEEFSPMVRYAFTRRTPHEPGHYQRNVGMSIAVGTHLSFLDDDDAVEKDYIKRIKSSVKDDDKIHLFKIVHNYFNPFEPHIWIDKVVRISNVSTQMIVVPNTLSLPKWNTRIPEADYSFIIDSMQIFGDPVWHEDLIAIRNGGYEQPKK